MTHQQFKFTARYSYLPYVRVITDTLRILKLCSGNRSPIDFKLLVFKNDLKSVVNSEQTI